MLHFEMQISLLLC